MRQILTHRKTHTADGMHEEECPTNVADSENIQQLDIRVVRVDTALRGNEGTIVADPSSVGHSMSERRGCARITRRDDHRMERYCGVSVCFYY